MSASALMEFKMTEGSDEDFQAILNVLQKIGGQEIEEIRGLNIGNYCFDISNSFSKFWDYYLEINPIPYALFAKAAPKAEWNASSERCDESDGLSSEDKAWYSDGILRHEYNEYFNERRMNYSELYEYVWECYDWEDKDRKEIKDGLTLKSLEECFSDISNDVIKLFDDTRMLKAAEYVVEDLDDERSLALYSPRVPDENIYIIKEFFTDGKETESLEGKTFVITGKLNYFPHRDAIKQYIKKNGGFVAKTLSKDTDFLVFNKKESDSDEAKKAFELNIPMINEEEFISRFGFPGEYDEE